MYSLGARPEIVKSAVDMLDSSGGAEACLERLSRYAPVATRVVLKGNSRNRKPQQSGWMMAYTSGLFGLRYEDRLALEMALHEDVEMRALQGELHGLERAWRDAEEIAAIADGIITPSPMRSALNRLRRLGQ